MLLAAWLTKLYLLYLGEVNYFVLYILYLSLYILYCQNGCHSCTLLSCPWKVSNERLIKGNLPTSCPQPRPAGMMGRSETTQLNVALMHVFPPAPSFISRAPYSLSLLSSSHGQDFLLCNCYLVTSSSLLLLSAACCLPSTHKAPPTYIVTIPSSVFRSSTRMHTLLIIMNGERNNSMGSPMDGTPPQSEVFH